MIVETLYKTEQQEKWARHYYKLCNRALSRKPSRGVYYEQHHMLPKCQWGENKILVLLTPEEHYVAHELLVKMFPEHKGLKFAAFMLTKKNNKEYGWVRREWSRSQLGMTGKKHSPATKQKISEAQKGEKGYWFGRQRTDDEKQKISETLKSAGGNSTSFIKGCTPWNKGKTGQKRGEYTKVTCPHCGKSGGGGSMKRWHFDKCKERK